MSKSEFKIPVFWEMYGFVEIEAETLDKALEAAEKNLDELPLPTDGNYVEASFGIDYEAADTYNEN